MNFTIKILKDHYSVVQLPPDDPFPSWVNDDDFLAIVKTSDELSVVSNTKSVPEGGRSEHGWRVLGIADVLDFTLVGVFSDISLLLAGVGVSIFVISTYNTDYFLVKHDQLNKALDTLRKAGHRIEGK
jgi:hypothetical protein